MTAAARTGAGLALIVGGGAVGATATTHNGVTLLALIMIALGIWVAVRARPERATSTRRTDVTYATERPTAYTPGAVTGDIWIVTTGALVVELWRWNGTKWRRRSVHR